MTARKPSKRPDLVGKSKKPQPHGRRLWVYNPPEAKVIELVKLAELAHERIQWGPPARGEKRVKVATDLAVEYGVHREIVYVLRRAYHFFEGDLAVVLRDIGFHRLHVLLMAHDRAPSLYREGVRPHSRARRKAIRQYKTEELREVLRARFRKTKREAVPEGKKGMAVVRPKKFKDGTMKENLDRILALVEHGLEQARTRLRSGNRGKDRTSSLATVDEFFDDLRELIKTHRSHLLKDLVD